MKKTYRRHSEEFKQEVIDHMRNTTNFSLQEMCHAFNISRSGYRHHSSDKITQLKAWRINVRERQLEQYCTPIALHFS